MAERSSHRLRRQSQRKRLKLLYGHDAQIDMNLPLFLLTLESTYCPSSIRQSAGSAYACAETMRALALDHALQCFVQEAPVPTLPALSPRGLRNIENGRRKLSKEDVKGMLTAIYLVLRRYNAHETISKISSSLQTSLWSDDFVPSAFWVRDLVNLDPRIPGPHDSASCSYNGPMQWAESGLRGYFRQKDGSLSPLHDFMEDVLYVPKPRHCFLHVPSSTPVHLFCLSDGHGGRFAAEWFVKRLPGCVLEFLNGKKSWVVEDSGLLKDGITRIFKELDDAFCAMREEQYYRAYKRRTAGLIIDQELWDDGCTLALVIVFDRKWILTAHCGDSRIVIGNGQDSSEEGRTLTCCLRTWDHAVSHPRKARFIKKAGGVFREFTGTGPIITRALPFDVDSSVPFLANARVCRPPGYTSPFGMRLKNLGMGDAMGDVTMKVEPRLFEGLPDVEIMELDSAHSYAVIMASDGLWSYMREDQAEGGNIQRLLREFSIRYGAAGQATFPAEHLLQELSDDLCLRHTGPLSSLFSSAPGGTHDDVSVIVVDIPVFNTPIV
ncbi:hypothetical protein HDU85_002030 [Gaertneriomyces sp. JEL0708]|nr:hypothetical protein HDU85_002030 [Gaertneriomyces sp. JEL0708]